MILSSFVYLPLLSSDDDVLDTVHEQLTINAAGMHGAEEVSSLVLSFTCIQVNLFNELVLQTMHVCSYM